MFIRQNFDEIRQTPGVFRQFYDKTGQNRGLFRQFAVLIRQTHTFTGVGFGGNTSAGIAQTYSFPARNRSNSAFAA